MSKKLSNRKYRDSAYKNNATFIQYFDRLTELAISSFKWEGLPGTIDARFLEMCLFTDGACVFFEDDILGFLALKVSMNGGFDVYGIPTNRRAMASNGYNKMLTSDNSVIIFNNMLHKNSVLDVDMFAKRLYNLDRAIDVNANAQKTPVLIKCDENQRLTMTNLYMQYDGNQPFIFADRGLNDNNFAVLRTDAPYVADKLYQLKTEYWNEALTYLGIPNTNVAKKERMVVDEVTRGMGGVFASRNSRLNARQKAAEQINDMFGLNISVTYDDAEIVGENIEQEEGEQIE